MAELTPIPLATASAASDSPFVTMERLLNLYAEPHTQAAKAPLSLRGTPGLKPWSTIGEGPIRGMRVMGGRAWIVSGDTVYEVQVNKTAVARGTIEGSGNVFMTDNAIHVAIAASTYAYAVNSDEIITLEEVGLNGATYQDGYGIFSQAGTENFWISGLDDLTTIGALDFSTADAFADTLVGCISDHRELWLFGKSTIEIWQNVGDAAFPFVRAGGGFMERGCASGGSIAKGDNSVYWLGDDRRVYTAQGYQPQRISTATVERSIEQAVSPESAWSFVYQQNGHNFYLLGLSDRTWCYDITTNLWHERQSEGLTRWRAQHMIEFDGKILVGDYEHGQIYELDLDTYDDDGDTITREIVSPPIHAGTHRVSMHELRLDLQAGVGLTSGQGSDPQWMLDWTDDAGHSWSDEVWVGAGAIGQYGRQARWHRLGSFRTRSIRLRMTDPVLAVVLGAYARLEGADT
jgi:hypothetical protein